jgi:hypothetical protein
MVRQQGEGAEPVAMLGSQPVQLTQRNDRYRRHSRASTPEWEIEDSGCKAAVPPWFSAAARPTQQDSGWVQAGGVESA